MMTLREHKSDSAHYFLDENGYMQGHCTLYHNNGKTRARCFVIDGDVYGESRQWHDNGQIQHVYNYVKGVRHGECKEWYKYSGQLKSHFFYFEGKIHGEYKEWDDFGKLVLHLVCVDDCALDVDAETLTDKDKFALTLRYGIQWL